MFWKCWINPSVHTHRKNALLRDLVHVHTRNAFSPPFHNLWDCLEVYEKLLCCLNSGGGITPHVRLKLTLFASWLCCTFMAASLWTHRRVLKGERRAVWGRSGADHIRPFSIRDLTWSVAGRASFELHSVAVPSDVVVLTRQRFCPAMRRMGGGSFGLRRLCKWMKGGLFPRWVALSSLSPRMS